MPVLFWVLYQVPVNSSILHLPSVEYHFSEAPNERDGCCLSFEPPRTRGRNYGSVSLFPIQKMGVKMSVLITQLSWMRTMIAKLIAIEMTLN